jgi:hypothetical protein
MSEYVPKWGKWGTVVSSDATGQVTNYTVTGVMLGDDYVDFTETTLTLEGDYETGFPLRASARVEGRTELRVTGCVAFADRLGPVELALEAFSGAFYRGLWQVVRTEESPDGDVTVLHPVGDLDREA